MERYEKQNFVSGQVLKASELNHIEDGIEKILPVIEAGNEKQLVTDTDGNLAWIDVTHGWTIDYKTCIDDVYFTGETLDGNMIKLNFLPEIGALAIATIGEKTLYGTVIEPSLPFFQGEIHLCDENNVEYFKIPITKNLFEIPNQKGIAGTFNLKAQTKIYSEIDINYLPIKSAPGRGAYSVVINNSSTSLPSTAADGYCSTSICAGEARGDFSCAIGGISSGYCSFTEGYLTEAKGHSAHAGGQATIAAGEAQVACGKYNIEDAENKYAYIVGNGSFDAKENVTTRSNAYTLDWSGNAWHAGTVEGTAMILKSPNGTRFQIAVSDDGTLSAAAITE